MDVSFYVMEYFDLTCIVFSIYTFNFFYIKIHIEATCIPDICFKKKIYKLQQNTS